MASTTEQHGPLYARLQFCLLQYANLRVLISQQLALSVFSPWQFFCSVSTFSNSLETTLTAAALSFWPWLSVSSAEQVLVTGEKKSKADSQHAATPNPASLI